MRTSIPPLGKQSQELKTLSAEYLRRNLDSTNKIILMEMVKVQKGQKDLSKSVNHPPELEINNLDNNLNTNN